MSNQQPSAWQTAGRPRNSHSASRTPQNRSGTASPSQPTPPSQPPAGPRQDPGRPQQMNSVWNNPKSSSAGGSNGQARTDDEAYQPVNGFNAAEVKTFLSRDAGVAAYKPADGARAGGGAWGSKPNHMANNQPFLTQLAKQIATLEGGG